MRSLFAFVCVAMVEYCFASRLRAGLAISFLMLGDFGPSLQACIEMSDHASTAAPKRTHFRWFWRRANFL